MSTPTTPETSTALDTVNTPASGPPASPIKQFELYVDRWVATSLAKMVTGGDPKSTEMFTREIYACAADLAGPNPKPIERTLAETAALSWFAFRYYEGVIYNESDRSQTTELYQQKRADAAHRRYLATLRTLAHVRKLALPAMQVNIGTHQVNSVTGA